MAYSSPLIGMGLLRVPARPPSGINYILLPSMHQLGSSLNFPPHIYRRGFFLPKFMMRFPDTLLISVHADLHHTQYNKPAGAFKKKVLLFKRSHSLHHRTSIHINPQLNCTQRLDASFISHFLQLQYTKLRHQNLLRLFISLKH